MGAIYCIENIINNKKYIGSTTNWKERQYRHKIRLYNNYHDNPHLQNSYNKYGADYFNFYIIEDNIPDEVLIDREAYWTRFYSALNPQFGYNDVEELGGGARRLSEETKLKISEGKIGEKNPMYGKSGELSPTYGRSPSKETRQKISEAHKDKPLSEEHKRKIGESQQGDRSSNYGKSPSDEARQKMSENHADVNGENNPRSKLTEIQAIEIIELLKQGELSCKKIGEIYNVSKSAICRIKENKNWKYLSR